MLRFGRSAAGGPRLSIRAGFVLALSLLYLSDRIDFYDEIGLAMAILFKVAALLLVFYDGHFFCPISTLERCLYGCACNERSADSRRNAIVGQKDLVKGKLISFLEIAFQL